LKRPCLFFIKRHLHHNHAGQSNTPVLLSNDALLSNPNTKYDEKNNYFIRKKNLFFRFQCGLCRRYQSNVDEFIKHITEKHRMDVCITNVKKKNNNK